MPQIHDKLTFTAQPSMNEQYFYLPFSVPKEVEVMEMSFCYSRNKKIHPQKRNALDVGLIDPDGKQVGTTGQKVKRIVLSERFATHGYHPVTPAAGKWKLLIGVACCEEDGLTATFNFTYTLKQFRWLKGDTHIHTVHSDGAYEPEKVFKKIRKKGLDYAIITDHNVNMSGQYYHFWDPKTLIINGFELTSFNGHINLWGVKNPLDLPFGFNTPEEYKNLFAQAEERGCTVSINHPTCKICGWRFWDFPDENDKPVEEKRLPEDIRFDCCEVWNGPMRIDNMTAIKWWHNQLLKGNRLPAVGGSDYHQNYVGVNLLAKPTTYVYAKSDTTEDVLAALRAGRSFITDSPRSTQIFLTVNDAMVGETTPFAPGTKATVKLIKPKRGHLLRVYNNDKVIFVKKLTGEKELTYEIALQEKGFVRAEILYRYNGLIRAIYKKVIALLMPKDVGLPIPDFCYALTNPIWLE